MTVKEGVAVLSVVIAFVGIAFVAIAIKNTGHTDCTRTQGIVVGIYTILDRSSARTQQYVDEGIITQKQADEAKIENSRVRSYITLPRC